MVLNIIYQTGKKFLDKDISKTQNEYGCAESENYIFKEAIGEEIGGDVSTYRMYLLIKDDIRFTKEDFPKEGDVILSPTGFGEKGKSGHVGIISNEGKIMSNNSISYLWTEHLTLKEWKKTYKNFPIHFFRYKYGEAKELEDCIPYQELKIENDKLKQELKEYKEANKTIINWIAFYFKK